MLQFVLPTAFHEKAIQVCHDNSCHLEIERYTHLLKDTNIEKYVKQCPRCLRFKMLPKRTELNPIVATHPWELIHIDFLTIKAPENSKSVKDINLLIVTDHFIRYAQAFLTTSQQVPVVAKEMWDKFFMYYGILEKLLSAHDQNFESKLIKE